MADLQSCCRHTTLVRQLDHIHNYHGQIDDVTLSNDNSYSTSPRTEESKLRTRSRRSLALFASYLGTHHLTITHGSRTEWPSIDWSNINILNDKDGVYKPDTELMCTAITQQLLANPTADLPAHFNTFLLHLIEVYHQSKADVCELQMKLVEKNECDHAPVDKIHGGISSPPPERASILQSLGNENSNAVHSTRRVKDANATGLSKNDSTDKFNVDYENEGPKHQDEDKSTSRSSQASRRRYADLR